MMGLDTTVTKVQVFALSSAIAGLGGALYAGLLQTATAGDYELFDSLPVVLLAVLGGITAVSGALVGGLVLAGFPVLADNVSFARGWRSSDPGSSASPSRASPMASCSCSPTLWRGRGGAVRADDAALPRAYRGARHHHPVRVPVTAAPSTEPWRSTVPEPVAVPETAPPVLELRGLRAGYGRIEVLRGIDLVVPAGAIVGLLGPNGAGKSTTLAAISGQLSPTRGHDPHDGRRCHRCPAPRRWPAPVCARSPRAGASSRTSPSTRTCWMHSHGARRAPPRPRGRLRATSRCSPSAGTCWPGTSPAASSRCCRSPARSPPTRARSSSTSSRWAWRR